MLPPQDWPSLRTQDRSLVKPNEDSATFFGRATFITLSGKDGPFTIDFRNVQWLRCFFF